MKRLYALLAVVFVVLATPGPARAADSVLPCSITATTATVCRTNPGRLTGFYGNFSAVAGTTVVVTCYDNASALSGARFILIPGAGGGQSVTLPPGGWQFVNGLTCGAATTITGGTLDMYFGG
jgi:hypothetical protein